MAAEAEQLKDEMRSIDVTMGTACWVWQGAGIDPEDGAWNVVGSSSQAGVGVGLGVGDEMVIVVLFVDVIGIAPQKGGYCFIDSGPHKSPTAVRVKFRLFVCGCGRLPAATFVVDIYLFSTIPTAATPSPIIAEHRAEKR